MGTKSEEELLKEVLRQIRLEEHMCPKCYGELKMMRRYSRISAKRSWSCNRCHTVHYL